MHWSVSTAWKMLAKLSLMVYNSSRMTRWVSYTDAAELKSRN